MEYLFIISFGLLAFFFLSLLGRRGKKLSEWIFLSWIFLLMITEVSFLIYARGNAGKFPMFSTILCDTHLFHPVLLFLYIKSFTNLEYRLKSKTLIHLIPLLVLVAAKLYTNFGLKVMECYEDGSCFNADNAYVTAFYVYKYAVMVFYIVASHKLVKQHQRHLKTQNDIERNLWVKNLVLGTIFLFVGILLIQIFRVAFPVHLYDRMLITSTLTTLFTYLLLYVGNSHASIFVAESRTPPTKVEAPSPSLKEMTESILKSAEDKALFSRVDDHVASKKSYLNGMLTLKDMADELECPQRQLSQCINNITGQSFTHYVNSYRVNHLKNLLDDPEKKHFTILSLAEESGFNSKTTLVRIFKQHTGSTPSEYLNRNTNNN